jgi:hypothetical protein
VIDSLVRKPGAFESYRYRDELFPTSRFRMAYDGLRESCGTTASREYLKILELAARENESGVDRALGALLSSDTVISSDAVKEFLESEHPPPVRTDVMVADVDLMSFDSLLTDKELWHGSQHGREREIADLPA